MQYTLSQRYVILKNKLMKEIGYLEWLKSVNLKMDNVINKQIRLHRQTLDLLYSVFNGEDDEVQ